jgi:hypothetical protein
MAMAGSQARDRAGEAASVRLLSHAAKAKKPSPSRAAAILLTTKANPISIAKTQTEKPWRPDKGLIVPVAIVRTAVVEIAGVGAVGIAEVGAVVLEVAAIVVLVAAVAIAAIARTAISNWQIAISL